MCVGAYQYACCLTLTYCRICRPTPIPISQTNPHSLPHQAVPSHTVESSCTALWPDVRGAGTVLSVSIGWSSNISAHCLGWIVHYTADWEMYNCCILGKKKRKAQP